MTYAGIPVQYGVLLVLGVKMTDTQEDMTLGTPKNKETVWAWLHVLRTGIAPQNESELSEWARRERDAYHVVRLAEQLDAKRKAKARKRFRVITNDEKET